jgi:hypothetical protein
MTNANKRKGDRAEVAVRDWLRLHGFPHCERTRAGYTRDYGDLHLCPGVLVQTKDVSAYRWGEWWQQLAEQVSDAHADHGVLVKKLRGIGDPGQWIAAVPLAEYARLLRAAGYGEPI